MTRRRFLAPEVIQSSAMDCGPAALKCLLDGHGRPVSYGRLREACQTDVDGSSLDTLEAVALQLGLEAEQLVLPVEHLLLAPARALPALAVTTLGNGTTHFVVVWRTLGAWVQVMDPGHGRFWVHRARFERSLYRHAVPVPAKAFREFLESRRFRDPLEARLAALGFSREDARSTVDLALERPGWEATAALDASARAVGQLVDRRALPRRAAVHAVRALAAQASTSPAVVPDACWTARPCPAGEDGEARVELRGAVALAVHGVRPGAQGEGEGPLSSSIQEALRQEQPSPARALWRAARDEAGPALPVIALAVALAGAATAAEGLLLRALVEVSGRTVAPLGKLAAAALTLALGAGILFLEQPAAAALRRLGRRLELRVRVALLEKLPRLDDRYFHSRLNSDMAERGHSLHRVRVVPLIAGQTLRTLAALGFTTLGLCWLDPALVPLALAISGVTAALPWVALPVLTERDLTARSLAGGLSRFYLDALLGAVAVRASGAQPAVRGEHERQLDGWARAAASMQQAVVVVEALQAAVGVAGACALVALHHARFPESPSLLLLLYWALQLPALGADLSLFSRQYPYLRSVMLRLLEPLTAPEAAHAAKGATVWSPAGTRAGVEVALTGVSVHAAGKALLEDVTLRLAPGEHVAVVGPSGAGKSTLVGLLLGWHAPASGTLTVDGAALDADSLAALRPHTAWVDPAVWLWNRTLVENVFYGEREARLETLSPVLEHADLKPLLESLRLGLQTEVGDGGGALSGGEGQRVRLARAMVRKDARLVILDEPFRGLEREERRRLLASARALWRGATLICITHDVEETLDFARVLVVEGGRVVEDARPGALRERDGSRYRTLLEVEGQVRERLWGGPRWRRLRLAPGGVVEERTR